jgi:hypothetical protein
MQVFQTEGEPPNKGNNNLPNKGCKTNISAALTNKVPANKRIAVSFEFWLIEYRV